MFARVHRALAVFLIAWLPIQASAMPSLMRVCEQTVAGEQAAVAGQEQASHEVPCPYHMQVAQVDRGDPQAAGVPENGGESSHGAGHPCCHVTASPAPSALVSITLPIAGFPAAAPIERAYAFFPEQAQRPPLAA